MPRPASPELLSVVLPCYNEELVIAATHERIARALGDLGMQLEIIYVDDGSADGTVECLRKIQASDPRVRVVLLSRNFGHQIASTAGLEEARGDCVVIMDADLQDPPELVREMLEKWREGYEVVYATRTQREGETKIKLFTAHWFYKILDWLSDTKIPRNTGDFRLMDRKVVDALKAMPEHDRFLRGMVSWIGFRQYALPYKRDARAAGESKYSTLKLIRLAADGIVSFSLKPLRLAMALGGVACATAAIGFVVAIVLVCLGRGPGLFTSLMLTAAIFFSGTQLVCMGIMGEYLGRIYRGSKQRPLYLVRERLGAPATGLLVVPAEQQEAA